MVPRRPFRSQRFQNSFCHRRKAQRFFRHGAREAHRINLPLGALALDFINDEPFFFQRLQESFGEFLAEHLQRSAAARGKVVEEIAAAGLRPSCFGCRCAD